MIMYVLFTVVNWALKSLSRPSTTHVNTMGLDKYIEGFCWRFEATPKARHINNNGHAVSRRRKENMWTKTRRV